MAHQVRGGTCSSDLPSEQNCPCVPFAAQMVAVVGLESRIRVENGLAASPLVDVGPYSVATLEPSKMVLQLAWARAVDGAEAVRLLEGAAVQTAALLVGIEAAFAEVRSQGNCLQDAPAVASGEAPVDLNSSVLAATADATWGRKDQSVGAK